MIREWNEESLDHRNIKTMAFIKQLVRFCLCSNPQGVQILFCIEILDSTLRGKGQNLFFLSLLYPG